MVMSILQKNIGLGATKFTFADEKGGKMRIKSTAKCLTCKKSFDFVVADKPKKGAMFCNVTCSGKYKTLKKWKYIPSKYPNLNLEYLATSLRNIGIYVGRMNNEEAFKYRLLMAEYINGKKEVQKCRK